MSCPPSSPRVRRLLRLFHHHPHPSGLGWGRKQKFHGNFVLKLEALFHRGGSPGCGGGGGWRAQHPFLSNHVVPNTKPWGRREPQAARLSQLPLGWPGSLQESLCLSLLCLSLRLLRAGEETLPWSQATPLPPVPLPSPRRFWLTPWPENSLDHSHPGAVVSPTLHSRPHWESWGEPRIPPSVSRPTPTQHLRGGGGALTAGI